MGGYRRLHINLLKQVVSSCINPAPRFGLYVDIDLFSPQNILKIKPELQNDTEWSHSMNCKKKFAINLFVVPCPYDMVVEADEKGKHHQIY
jgi:hypothetical protein